MLRDKINVIFYCVSHHRTYCLREKHSANIFWVPFLAQDVSKQWFSKWLNDMFANGNNIIASSYKTDTDYQCHLEGIFILSSWNDQKLSWRREHLTRILKNEGFSRHAKMTHRK